jgi:copper transport outer membrane protein MctB
LIGGSLKGHVVTVVALPTAPSADVRDVTRMVRVAGAGVAGTVRVGAQLLDVGHKQLVDELGTQLEGRAPGVTIPADASPYERMGALLARAVGSARPGGGRVDAPASSIMAGLSTANLASAQGSLSRRGDLVLFVTGPGHGSVDQQQGASTIVTTLVQSVDAHTRGVVLAGPAAAARAGGQILAVRSDVSAARSVSTVDSLDRTAAQVVTVMALAGQAAGRSGQYGAVDAANGAMPGARATD